MVIYVVTAVAAEGWKKMEELLRIEEKYTFGDFAPAAAEGRSSTLFGDG